MIDDQPRLIIQVPRDGAVERQLRAQPPPGLASGDVVIEAGPTDAQGALEALAGEVVLSVPSPEALRREPDEIRRVIAQAGTGIEALVVEVKAAEELRDDEVAAVVDAAGRSPRPVILRVIRNA